jgi:hypothetical protein
VAAQVLDAAAASDEGGHSEMQRALDALCAAIPEAQFVCSATRSAAEWIQHYPVLAARQVGPDLTSPVDVALAIRRVRSARRCALYALAVGVATVNGTMSTLLPYSAVGLRDLERWARAWQTGAVDAEPAVRPLPLVGPIDNDMDEGRVRMFPVIADVTRAAPMTINDLVALSYAEGPTSLYGQLVSTRQQVALPLANSVSKRLVDLLVQGLVATDSANAVPPTCLDHVLNIFRVYPGTRPAVARHLRSDPTDTIDLGVLLQLPNEEEDDIVGSMAADTLGGDDNDEWMGSWP